MNKDYQRTKMNVLEASQNIVPLTGTLNTENIFKPFYVTPVDDDEFNARMRENELYPGDLRDIHVQKFMDKGYNEHDASHRVAQYAMMGVLDIPGQFSTFNLLFDKDVSADTKDTFRDTLKSSFDNLSSSDIGLATSEMLTRAQTGGLTHVSSQILIKNEVLPIDLTNLDMSEAASQARWDKAMEPRDLFLLGPKVYYDNDIDAETQTSSTAPELSSTASIKKFFEDILEGLKTKESDSNLSEEEKSRATRGIDIFEHLIGKLGVILKDRLEESDKNEVMVNQYTKNNKPNPLEEKLQL